MSLIALRGLDVRHGAVPALTGVDLDIAPSEIVTIVGPNGSGKSTLLRAVIGALRPSAGTITRKPGLRVGYVPQKLHVDPGLPMTARRFLSLPARVGDAAAQEALARAGTEGLASRQMSELSGGQFQRVLLARALLSRPELLILDEPTQGLDQPGSADFYRLIERLRDEIGCAVLMVSHELHVVMAASDRVVCLNGHVCCHGAPEAVASAPEYRALFGSGTGGALALYRHEHDHTHGDGHLHGHGHGVGHGDVHVHVHDAAVAHGHPGESAGGRGHGNSSGGDIASGNAAHQGSGGSSDAGGRLDGDGQGGGHASEPSHRDGGLKERRDERHHGSRSDQHASPAGGADPRNGGARS